MAVVQTLPVARRADLRLGCGVAGQLDQADALEMACWHHGGSFSLDASVRIEGHDRTGLERLLRYCARPPFALDQLEQLPDDQLLYRFPSPSPMAARNCASGPWN